MREYPMALEEFEKKFNTEEACRDYCNSLAQYKNYPQ